MINKIAFETQGYRKNFDNIDNDNIVTEYIGRISNNDVENKPSLKIGEYVFSVWDLSIAKSLKINILDLMKFYEIRDSYFELYELISNKKFNIEKYKKIIIIHSLIIHPDYRKTGISEEFTEFIYRDFYTDDTAIILLAKPLQNNKFEFDFYSRQTIRLPNKINEDYDLMSINQYYSLYNLINEYKDETIMYKIFAIAVKCGFNRINESNLFLFEPKNTIERIMQRLK
jgi:hypothetical protein